MNNNFNYNRYHSREFIRIPSWNETTKRYGLIGDGNKNNTQGFLDMFTELGTSKVKSNISFIQKGNYNVDDLLLQDKLGVGIVGEDPANTIINLNGDKRILLDGVANCRFERLQFKGLGEGKTNCLIDQSWLRDDNPDLEKGHFDTGNLYDDIWLEGATEAWRGGFKGNGAAETIFKNFRVKKCKVAFSLGNFNALDFWPQNGFIEDCLVGITNNENWGSGNFKSHDVHFRNVRYAMVIGHTGSFDIQRNTMINGDHFLYAGFTDNPCEITMGYNTLINVEKLLYLENHGTATLIENRVKLKDGQKQAIYASKDAKVHVIGFGNTFNVENIEHKIDRGYMLQDQYMSNEEFAKLSLPTTPHPVPQHDPNRTITEVGDCTGEVLQAAINKAHSIKSQAVVHFTKVHTLTPISVPVNSDITVLSDTLVNQIYCPVIAPIDVFTVNYPTRAKFKHFNIKGERDDKGIYRGRNLVIKGADKDTDRIFFFGSGTGSNNIGMVIKGFSKGLIYYKNSNIAQSQETGLVSENSRLVQDCCSGSNTNNIVNKIIGGLFYSFTVWYENHTDNFEKYIEASGKGDVVIAHSDIAIRKGNLLFKDFEGRGLVIGCFTQAVKAENSDKANLLLVSSIVPEKSASNVKVFFNQAYIYPVRDKGGSEPIEDIEANFENVLKSVRLLRDFEVPVATENDLTFNGVGIGQGNVGITIEGGNATYVPVVLSVEPTNVQAPKVFNRAALTPVTPAPVTPKPTPAPVTDNTLSEAKATIKKLEAEKMQLQAELDKINEEFEGLSKLSKKDLIKLIYKMN